MVNTLILYAIAGALAFWIVKITLRHDPSRPRRNYSNNGSTADTTPAAGFWNSDSGSSWSGGDSSGGDSGGGCGGGDGGGGGGD